VVAAATFKAKALAVMRHVQQTGVPVTVTSRGEPLVRIEAVREHAVPTGYGAMRGTVEFLVPEEELTMSANSGPWGTLEEWDEASEL
jgi:prevent-host-death family protein